MSIREYATVYANLIGSDIKPSLSLHAGTRMAYKTDTLTDRFAEENLSFLKEGSRKCPTQRRFCW